MWAKAKKNENSQARLKHRTQARKLIIQTSGQGSKGVWRKPRHAEAKKDGANTEMRRGAVSRQRTGDVRMGKPA